MSEANLINENCKLALALDDSHWTTMKDKAKKITQYNEIMRHANKAICELQRALNDNSEAGFPRDLEKLYEPLNEVISLHNEVSHEENRKLLPYLSKEKLKNITKESAEDLLHELQSFDKKISNTVTEETHRIQIISNVVTAIMKILSRTNDSLIRFHDRIVNNTAR